MMIMTLFTTIPGACRVILVSTHPNRHDVIDFLVERLIYLQDQPWKAQKTRHVTLDNSIPTPKHYREHIYFVFILVEPALLGSKILLMNMHAFQDILGI